jgi:hypothetical protein
VWLGAVCAPGAVSGLDRRPVVGILVDFEQKPAPEFLKQVRSEVEHFFRPSGVRLEWHTKVGKGMGTFDRVVRITVRGRCGISYAGKQGLEEGVVHLGWTVFEDGEATSQVVVDCDRIAQIAGHTLGWYGNPGMLYLHYIRLAGRVVGHEMLHVLLDTSAHSDSDLNRRVLRLDDLRREARLAPLEIEQLRRLAMGGAAVARASPPGR